MVIDSYGTKQEEAEEKVQKALGIQDDPYEIVTVDESLRTGEDGVALESYSQMALYHQSICQGSGMCLLVAVRLIWTVLSSKMSILWI